MAILVRPAQKRDLEAMVNLLIQLFTIETDFEIDPARHRRGLKMMIDGCGKHRCVYVAEADEGVVGMATAQSLISTAKGHWVALVEDVVIDVRFRAQGIGRRLMAAIETWAVAHGAARLQLLADRTNFTALDFYDRLGWRPTRLICLHRLPNSLQAGSTL
jgi:GNAT superfamily N-acetyltransferase